MILQIDGYRWETFDASKLKKMEEDHSDLKKEEPASEELPNNANRPTK
mgnify:CR=1 FL=1